MRTPHTPALPIADSEGRLRVDGFPWRRDTRPTSGRFLLAVSKLSVGLEIDIVNLVRQCDGQYLVSAGDRLTQCFKGKAHAQRVLGICPHLNGWKGLREFGRVPLLVEGLSTDDPSGSNAGGENRRTIRLGGGGGQRRRCPGTVVLSASHGHPPTSAPNSLVEGVAPAVCSGLSGKPAGVGAALWDGGGDDDPPDRTFASRDLRPQSPRPRMLPGRTTSKVGPNGPFRLPGCVQLLPSPQRV